MKNTKLNHNSIGEVLIKQVFCNLTARVKSIADNIYYTVNLIDTDW